MMIVSPACAAPMSGQFECGERVSAHSSGTEQLLPEAEPDERGAEEKAETAAEQRGAGAVEAGPGGDARRERARGVVEDFERLADAIAGDGFDNDTADLGRDSLALAVFGAKPDELPQLVGELDLGMESHAGVEAPRVGPGLARGVDGDDGARRAAQVRPPAEGGDE